MEELSEGGFHEFALALEHRLGRGRAGARQAKSCAHVTERGSEGSSAALLACNDTMPAQYCGAACTNQRRNIDGSVVHLHLHLIRGIISYMNTGVSSAKAVILG